MAIVPLHKAITRQALTDAGFSEEAAERAARANARVDEKQGNDAFEANLHAMLGYVTETVADMPSRRIQTEDEAKQQVDALLTTARQNVTTNVLLAAFPTALDYLGAALHTVQDRAFHGFEPWPYAGIVEALTRAPNYMFMHGVRDLGGVSQLSVATGASRVHVAAEWTFQLNPHAYLSVQGFANMPVRAASAPRLAGSIGRDGFEGEGGMLTLTFGAAPGSRAAAPRVGGDDSGAAAADPSTAILTEGPAARAAALAASKAFVEDVRKQLSAGKGGDEAWRQFLMVGKRNGK